MHCSSAAHGYRTPSPLVTAGHITSAAFAPVCVPPAVWTTHRQGRTTGSHALRRNDVTSTIQDVGPCCRDCGVECCSSEPAVSWSHPRRSARRRGTGSIKTHAAVVSGTGELQLEGAAWLTPQQLVEQPQPQDDQPCIPQDVHARDVSHAAAEALEHSFALTTPDSADQQQPPPATCSSSSSTASSSNSSSTPAGPIKPFAFPPAERSKIRESWDALMRWSKVFRRSREDEPGPLQKTSKIVVFGGGSFGTAMGVALAGQKADMQVVLLVRDAALAQDINLRHCNVKYLKDFTLPPNVTATTVAAEAIAGAQYAVHAVPVQLSRAFLKGIKELLPASVPIICVSKGLEASSGDMMSDIIPSALGRRQPAVYLSGPSFAREVMQSCPTSLVAASKDIKLARTVQSLFASPMMRINTTTDEVGVEISGALKNVLAIAAGIVEGLSLGNNAMAALLTQGCAEIRWLAEKTGAKPTTVAGLSGLGDIMLTCYGDLSRNRSVGIRLGRGEKLEDIIASSSQVAEGVATAGAVVSLARKYRVSLPVLTAVAQVLSNALTPREAVFHVMNLPQIDET